MIHATQNRYKTSIINKIIDLCLVEHMLYIWFLQNPEKSLTIYSMYVQFVNIQCVFFRLVTSFYLPLPTS